MNNAPATTPDDSEPAPRSEQELRDAMVRRLIELGAARSPRVVAAFRAVPRHLATPGVDMAEAYDAEYVAVTKTDASGVDISSVSAARIQAMQIEQADIRPGMNVLEIGSGGVNAAYLTEMAGERGQVVTVDIDPDVTRRARDFLKATGYHNVTVVTADGEHGVPEHAPYDRIVVTVQAADVPPAWVHQLRDGGRLVVPLRMRGMTRTVAFVRDGERLVSDGFELCGFVPMQGAGENRMRLAVLHDAEGEEIALRLDGHPEPDTEALRAALRTPRAEAWSGVTLARRRVQRTPRSVADHRAGRPSADGGQARRPATRPGRLRLTARRSHPRGGRQLRLPHRASHERPRPVRAGRDRPRAARPGRRRAAGRGDPDVGPRPPHTPRPHRGPSGGDAGRPAPRGPCHRPAAHADHHLLAVTPPASRPGLPGTSTHLFPVKENEMASQTTGTTLKAATDFGTDGDADFDLRIETVASAPVLGSLLNDTSDGCTSTCQSACSNSTCIGG